MLGLVEYGTAGLYLLAQFVVGPLLGYWVGRKKGLGRTASVLPAVAVFLLVFVLAWHYRLPATIVYQCLKPSCGEVIYKPFEQWKAENPGVLARLEQTKSQQFADEQKRLGDNYPNKFIEHKGMRCELLIEYRSNGKPRLGWYSGEKRYVGKRTGKRIDVWYDIEKQEVLADRVTAYLRFWVIEWWYNRRSKAPHYVDFVKYHSFFDPFVNNTNKEKQ